MSPVLFFLGSKISWLCQVNLSSRIVELQETMSREIEADAIVMWNNHFNLIWPASDKMINIKKLWETQVRFILNISLGYDLSKTPSGS